MKSNFYRMSEEELNASIANIRGWLMKFGGHERWGEMTFILDVACRARDVLKDRRDDPFLEEVIDTLCG